MRTEPTWRIPFGVLVLFVLLGAYALFVAMVVPDIISSWPGLAQAPIYLAFGLAWLWPMKPFLKWMETGHWR